MSEALLENVSGLVRQMQGLARQAHAEYSSEVDALIEKRSCDTRRIERLLDGILDFGFDDTMVQLFKRLCRYYYTLDPAATADYIRIYRDMWDSDADESDVPPEAGKQANKTTTKYTKYTKIGGR